MSAFRDYLSSVVFIHWGNSPFQFFFYLGILLVLLLEKRREVRVVLGWLPLLFLLVIYNPLFGQVLSRVIPSKSWAYLSRLFTFVPLFYVVAHGAVLLLSRLKDGAKFLCVCLLGAVIALSGESVYHQYWMRPAANAEKAQTDAVEMVDLLRSQGENLCVAAPQEVSVYLRQLDANLLTPYGRYVNKLGKALGSEAPDPLQVMTWAGEQAVDVLAVWNREGIRESFAAGGWEPFAETSNCLLYTVSGVPRWVRTVDEKRRLASKTTLDAEGNPVLNENGYVTIRYEYDDAGMLVRQSYYDENGQPMKRYKKKYASQEFIDDGQEKILVRYYDLEGNLVKEGRQKRK